jgi:Fe2+ transport system protein FeoA
MSRASNAACMPLLELQPGQLARLCVRHPNDSIPPRLLELGIVPGTPFHLRRCAPLGDPWEISIRGCHLCLRSEELEGLCAQPEPVGS